MILELGTPVSGDAGFESQRTVMAAVTRAVSTSSSCANITYTLYLSSDNQGSEMGGRRGCGHTCPSCPLLSAVRYSRLLID